jgi:hypothetical protein
MAGMPDLYAGDVIQGAVLFAADPDPLHLPGVDPPPGKLRLVFKKKGLQGPEIITQGERGVDFGGADSERPTRHIRVKGENPVRTGKGVLDDHNL